MGEDQRDNGVSHTRAETQEEDERCRESRYVCCGKGEMGESKEGREEPVVIPKV